MSLPSYSRPSSVHVRFLPNQSQTFQQLGVCRCLRTPNLPLSTSGSAESIPNLPTTRCLSLPSYSKPSSVHVRFLSSQPQTFQQRGVCRFPRTPDLPLSTSGVCPVNPKPSNNAVCVASLVLQTFLCPRQVSAESIPNLPTTRCLSLPSYSRPSSVHVRFLPNQSQTFQQRGVRRCPRTPDLPLSTSGFCPVNPKPSNNAVFVAALVLQTFLCPRQVSVQSTPNLPTMRCLSLPSYSKPSSVHVRFLPNQSQTFQQRAAFVLQTFLCPRQISAESIQTFQQRGVRRCPRTPDLPLSTSGFCPVNPQTSQQRGVCRCPRTPDLPLSTSGFCPINPKPPNNAVFVAALVLQTFLCPRQVSAQSLPNLPTTRCLSLPSYSGPSSVHVRCLPNQSQTFQQRGVCHCPRTPDLPLSTSGLCPVNPKPSNNAVFVAALVLQTFLCPRQVSAQSVPNLPTTRCLSLPSYSRPSSAHVRFLPNQSQTFQQRGVCRCPRTPDLPLSTSGFCPINPKPSNNAVFVAALVLQAFLCPRQVSAQSIPNLPTTRCLSLNSFSRPSSVHVRFLPNQSQTSGFCPINPKPSNNAVFVVALVLQAFLCPRQVSAQSIPNLPTTRCLSLPSCSRPSSAHVRFLPNQSQTFQQRGVCRCPRTPGLPLSTSGFCQINPKPSNNAVFVAALVLQAFLCPRQVSAQSIPNLPTTRCLSLPSYSTPSSAHVRFLPNQSQTFQQRGVCRCPRTPGLPLSTSGFCPINPKPSNNAVFVAALVLQTFLCPRQVSAQSIPNLPTTRCLSLPSYSRPSSVHVRLLPNQSQTFQQRGVCRCPRTPNLPLPTSGFCPINPKPSNNAVFVAALVLQTFLCPRQVSAQSIPNLPTM